MKNFILGLKIFEEDMKNGTIERYSISKYNEAYMSHKYSKKYGTKKMFYRLQLEKCTMNEILQDFLQDLSILFNNNNLYKESGFYGKNKNKILEIMKFFGKSNIIKLGIVEYADEFLLAFYSNPLPLIDKHILMDQMNHNYYDYKGTLAHRIDKDGNLIIYDTWWY